MLIYPTSAPLFIMGTMYSYPSLVLVNLGVPAVSPGSSMYFWAIFLDSSGDIFVGLLIVVSVLLGRDFLLVDMSCFLVLR